MFDWNSWSIASTCFHQEFIFVRSISETFFLFSALFVSKIVSQLGEAYWFGKKVMVQREVIWDVGIGMARTLRRHWTRPADLFGSWSSWRGADGTSWVVGFLWVYCCGISMIYDIDLHWFIYYISLLISYNISSFAKIAFGRWELTVRLSQNSSIVQSKNVYRCHCTSRITYCTMPQLFDTIFASKQTSHGFSITPWHQSVAAPGVISSPWLSTIICQRPWYALWARPKRCCCTFLEKRSTKRTPLWWIWEISSTVSTWFNSVVMRYFFGEIEVRNLFANG